MVSSRVGLNRWLLFQLLHDASCGAPDELFRIRGGSAFRNQGMVMHLRALTMIPISSEKVAHLFQ